MAEITAAELAVGAAGTVLTGAGGVIVKWFADQVIEVRDSMRSINHKLYGDPNQKTPDGLIADVNAASTMVIQVDGRVSALETRVAVVERGCIAQHGDDFLQLAREPRTNE